MVASFHEVQSKRNNKRGLPDHLWVLQRALEGRSGRTERAQGSIMHQRPENRGALRPSLDDGLSGCTHASEPMRALRSNHGCFISINLPRTAVPLTNDVRSKQAPFGTIVVGT